MVNNSIKILIFVKLRPRFKYGKGSGEVVIVNIQLKPYLLAIEKVSDRNERPFNADFTNCASSLSTGSNGFAHEKRIRQMNASIVDTKHIFLFVFKTLHGRMCISSSVFLIVQILALNKPEFQKK